MSEIGMMELLLEDQHPFKFVSLTSFDMISGINLVFNWKFPNQPELENLKEILKIPLSNVHRQEPKIFSSYPTMLGSIPGSDLLFSSSTFTTKNGNSLKYYSFILIFSASKIIESQYIYSEIEDQTSYCAKLCNYCFQNSKDLFLITPNIRAALENVIFCISFPITKSLSVFSLPSNLSSSSEQNFYATALSSHLQTQMTTIIEIEKNNDYLPLFAFLSKFLLPQQLALSSAEPHPLPVPGLFLQVTTTRPTVPFDTLMQFKRPWTWIRFYKRKIIQITDFETQEIVRVDYLTNILLEPDLDKVESQKRFLKIKRVYNPEESMPSLWALDLIHSLLKLPGHYISTFLQQKMIEALNKAITLMRMVDDMITTGGGTFLQPDQLSMIAKLTDLKDNEEMKIAVAIAQIFDQRVFRHVFAGRKEVLMQLIVTI